MKNRKPNRWKGYDYSQDNMYFVTSCIHGRICCFGEIIDGKMILNKNGKIAEKQWHWLGEQYPYIVLYEFIVMPNHIHGIIEINRAIVRNDNGGGGGDRDCRDRSRPVPTVPPIKIKSLSELIGAYKTTVSKKIHLLEQSDDSRCRDRSRPVPTFAAFPVFQWQRSFHDHIIRDESSYIRISEYIINNPSKWESDTFYNI
jgi:putative transposase